MRINYAAANWKMNLNNEEANNLASEIASLDIPSDVQVILGVPFPYLKEIAGICNNNNAIHVAAQDCSAHEKGAYTGEVAPSMLKSIGIDHVIIGHSERRQYHNEGDEILLNKLNEAFDKGLTPIFCCGEPLEVREANEQEDHVKQQIKNTLLCLNEELIEQVIIAYEPVWAIGTGKTASPEQAQEMHAFIRNILSESLGERSQNISILYGGSVKPANAKEIFGQKDVEGGLVGGASLNAESFKDIIHSF